MINFKKQKIKKLFDFKSRAFIFKNPSNILKKEFEYFKQNLN